MAYITRVLKEVDQETGLQKAVESYRAVIDAEKQQITVHYREVLISPNSVVVKIINDSSYVRYNRPGIDGAPDSMAYDQLIASQQGQLLISMLSNTLSNHPDLEQP